MKNFFQIAGIKLKKKDIVAFGVGMVLPLVLLFLLFVGLKQNGALDNMGYLELLLNGKRKLIYYFAVGLIEEFIFRGLLFGFLCKKTNRVLLSTVLSAIIFAVPHAVNSNIPVYVLLSFSFVFGISACEMRCLTKSIWMSTAFHWTWNYTIVNVFIETNTNQFIYLWIMIEVLILAISLYSLLKKQKEPLVIC